MRFVSFAQNMEIDNGFYIDVGAQSPHTDSVTKSFYLRGWRGINIEPSTEYSQELKQERPNDINLEFALGEANTSEISYLFSNTGLSTLNKAIAEKHQEQDRHYQTKSIKVTTLKTICEQYLIPEQPIHFLKIDAEGYETAIIKGLDWRAYRPWIFVIESTYPSTQTECHTKWESLVLAANYRFVYADGLNRIYLAEEHQELAPTFQYPPNIFDNFITQHLIDVETHIDHQNKEISQLRDDLVA